MAATMGQFESTSHASNAPQQALSANPQQALSANPQQALSSQQLEEAFAAFNRVSDELGSAWGELERRVAHLTTELAAARSARLSELAAKEALADKLSTLMEALPGAVVLINGGTIEDCNPAAETMLGSDLEGHTWTGVMSEISAQLPEGDGEFDCRDGRRMAVAYNELSNANAQIALITDISESHRLSQLLHREQRLRELGDMAARLAHQLRTPLSSAMLYLSQLNNRNTASEAHLVGDKVQERLRQIERLIEGMLRFIRGADDPVEQLCLAQLIRDNCEAMTPQLERANAELTLTFPVGGIEFLGQRELLENAISNLLDNSLQSCPEGVCIEVKLTLEDDCACLEISDNGPGIEPALQEKIFEPWFSTRTHGTGLGLAVVASAARAHGGQATAYTPDEGGSAFRLTLPLVVDKEQL